MSAVAGQPLDGIRVLDLSSPIGAYCTRVLADLGADVVLIEPPGGDPLRHLGPYKRGLEGPDVSLTFSYYHANKRGITLDQSDPDDRQTLRQLGRSADVIVISPSARSPLWGFDWETRELDWAASDSIVCSITPFGLTGPYWQRPATHLTAFAHSGAMFGVGEPGTPPREIPFQQHWHLASLHGAICVLAALGARDSVGGQSIDLSAQEVEVSTLLLYESYDAIGLQPEARAIAIGIPPTGTWRCRDGVVDIAAHQERHWEAFLTLLDHPDTLSEPSLCDMALRRQIFDGLIEIIADLLITRSVDELVDRGQAIGLPICAFNTPKQFVGDPQLAARDFFIDVGTAQTGPIISPGPGVLTTPRLFEVHRPAPRRDEHADEIRGERRSALQVRPTGSTTRALEGLRVLTLGAFVAGNTVGEILASMGATVAKVEPRSRPEVLRNAGFNYGNGLTIEPSGVPVTPMYASLTRGMMGLAIEMGRPEGRDLFRRLSGEADVVVENFGAGVMPGWGCGFDDLVAGNPELIMVSLSGYGRTGPRASHLAYASNISNFTGLSSVWSTAGMFTDYVTGAHAALAVLAARNHCVRTGEGVYIDAAQIECLAAMAGSMFLDPLVNGVDEEAAANYSEGALVTHVFRGEGDDRWGCVEVRDVEQWNEVCDLTNRPDLCSEDPVAARGNAALLREAISDWAAPLSVHTAAHRLARRGVPAAAVQSPEDVYNDPQLHHRHFPLLLDQHDLGVIQHPGSPHRMSKTPGEFTRTSPRLGEHTREILTDWISLDSTEFDRLVDSGVLFDAGLEKGQPR